MQGQALLPEAPGAEDSLNGMAMAAIASSCASALCVDGTGPVGHSEADSMALTVQES